jgi:hypothetical protein
MSSLPHTTIEQRAAIDKVAGAEARLRRGSVKSPDTIPENTADWM